MTSILQWISNLRLSIMQWGLLSLSVAVGGLVVALRVQGSKLHAAQINLLLATIRQSDTAQESAVVKAKEQLNIALKEYYGRTK